jgi:lambda family phage portal protein
VNWLDNLISFFSPEWGVRREAWRQNLEEIRNYDAGDYSRGNANWRVMNQSAEYTDKYSRDNVRARARDLERNSDMMNSVIGAYKRNVVGGGYTLQTKTGNDKLNDTIEAAWKKWCKKQNCDVTGTQSFMQIMRMCVKRKKVDGGILIVKRYTKDGFLPFKLQTFEVDELDNSQMTPKNQGNKVVGGIELNEYNKPVGYWIRQYPVDSLALTTPVYIDAKDVIFMYTKHRPSQVREISDMSPTITRIRDANEFMVAVSVKERIAACLSVFIKKTIPTTGIGNIGRGIGGAAGERQDYQGKSITPGMIKELNAGDEIQVVNPAGQATDAASYIKLQQRLVGAGQGVSYEATSRDMSQSTYSSTRQSIIEDDMTYAEEKELLMEVMDEIYETFVISLWLTGNIKVRDFWDKKDMYLEHTWIVAPKKWIDPQKEANANRIALATGQKTFKQIAAEQGKDWKEQIEEIAEVLNYAKELGIDMGGVIFDRPKNELYEEEEGEDDEHAEGFVAVSSIQGEGTAGEEDEGKETEEDTNKGTDDK